MTAAYTDQYNNYAWQEFESFFMEAVDADNDWAEYKLVATMADTSRRIIFFTDPTAASGQLQMLGFSNDFSAFYFDTGIRSWGEQAPSCDVNLEIQTPLPDDADTQDLTLRLDCWDADTGAPTTAAYTDQYNNYAWQEFTEIAMEAVDADNDWAAYKLVGTMADESKRIVFFTDPAATSGQMQMLGFNNDFSVFYFDTGIRTWGDTGDDSGDDTSTALLNLTFDSADSTSSWEEVADATSDEGSIAWSEAGGNPDGALSLTGENTADAGKAYIFQYIDGAFSYGDLGGNVDF